MPTARLFARAPDVVWVPHPQAFVHTRLQVGVDRVTVEDDLATATAAGDVADDSESDRAPSGQDRTVASLSEISRASSNGPRPACQAMGIIGGAAEQALVVPIVADRSMRGGGPRWVDHLELLRIRNL
jgi:hypothetical protein